MTTALLGTATGRAARLSALHSAFACNGSLLWLDFFPERSAGLEVLLGYLRRPSAVRPPPAGARTAYLTALYREIVVRLDALVALPVSGTRVSLLDIEGTLSGSGVGSVLPLDRFHPVRPRNRMGAREALRSGTRLAIVGPAGAGKTTTMMALARDLAGEAGLDASAPVPVLLSADTWAHGDTVSSWVQRLAPSLPDGAATVLLVDGLDEVPVVEKAQDGGLVPVRKELVEALAEVPHLVVAGRREAFTAELPVHRTLHLEELSERQVAAFTENLPSVAWLIGQDLEIAALARTPLMLALLCSAVEVTAAGHLGRHDATEARDTIIGDFVRARYERETALLADPPTLDALYLGLGQLAMLDSGGGGNRNAFGVEAVSRYLDHDELTISLLMKVLVRAGHATVRFQHLAIRDHFGFRRAVAALDDPDPAVRDRAAWALWQVPDPRAALALVRALDDPDEYVRGSAAGALGILGDRRAVVPLQALLTDHTEVVSMYGDSIAEVAAWALRRIQSVSRT